MCGHILLSDNFINMNDPQKTDLTSLDLKRLRSDLDDLMVALERFNVPEKAQEDFKDATKAFRMGKMLLGCCLGNMPNAGINLNADRDSKEVQEANEKDLKPGSEHVAKGEDPIESVNPTPEDVETPPSNKAAPEAVQPESVPMESPLEIPDMPPAIPQPQPQS